MELVYSPPSSFLARIVLDLADLDGRGLHPLPIFRSLPTVPVYFRTSRGMLVPYVKLVPWQPDKKLPIACIRSGPMQDTIMSTVAISMMLEKNRFLRVRVQGSGITLRY